MLTGENLVLPETNRRNASLVERRSHKVIGFTAHLNPKQMRSLELKK